MTALILSHFQGHDVRHLLVDGEPVWIGKDVCEVVGISKYRDALAQLDGDERVSVTVDTLGGPQTATAVTESGLWSLMLISRSPVVKDFKRWLTHEVLPAIRKTGSYGTPPALPDITTPAGVLAMAEQFATTARALVASEQKVAELAGPAESWEHFASTDGDLSVNEAAKVLSRHPGIAIGETRLWKWLDVHRWTYRDAAGDRRPYQDRIESGHLTTRARGHHHPSTGEWVIDAPQVRVPMKGVDLLRKHLASSLNVVAS